MKKLILIIAVIINCILVNGQHTGIQIDSLDIPIYGGDYGDMTHNPTPVDLKIWIYQDKVEVQMINGSYYSFKIIDFCIDMFYRSVTINLSDNEGEENRMIFWLDGDVVRFECYNRENWKYFTDRVGDTDLVFYSSKPTKLFNVERDSMGERFIE